ncbi:MAG: hypothetical protein Q8O43_05810 [Dehalococcoidia bacterium]|nr:hypothetical protein [Dehalococcoidia bacterium]
MTNDDVNKKPDSDEQKDEEKTKKEKPTQGKKFDSMSLDYERLSQGRIRTLKLDPAGISLSGIPTGSFYVGSKYPLDFLKEPGTLTSMGVSIDEGFLYKQDDLEKEISQLRTENRKLTREVAGKAESEQEQKKKIDELQNNIDELTKKQRLHHLLYRVNESARRKLLESEEFRRLFEASESCFAVVMSVDIRRSTELMLKARQPQLYAEFISTLCSGLSSIVLENYGVFDKFTGDGILAFFPEFYTGQDGVYWAIKAADECHHFFHQLYQARRNCFISVLTDVGLGIGIDYGKSSLIVLQDGLTVIGPSVVYACRFGGCDAGMTLLNQPAYEFASEHFSEYLTFQELEIDVKYEGPTLAYKTSLNKKPYSPKQPPWASQVPSSVSPNSKS